jgi:hypothetical protein
MTTSIAFKGLVRPVKFISPDQVESFIHLVRESAKAVDAEWALIGGLAMQWYGSPRLTRNCDVISSKHLSFETLEKVKIIPSGGIIWKNSDGFELSVRVRNDEYKSLFDGALKEAIQEDGMRIVQPEWLAAMKFACIDEKHTLDLHWILRRESKGLVDVKRVEQIVYDYLGGLFAKRSFHRTIEAVAVSLKLEPSLEGCEYP